MASYDAAINLIVTGGSKIDRIINKAAQLEDIVNSINRSPLEISTQKAASEFDKFDTNLKLIQSTIANQKKAIDQAGGSIEKYADAIASTQNQLSQLNPNTKKYNEMIAKQQKAILGLAGAQKDLADAQKKFADAEDRVSGAKKAAGRAKAAKEATAAIANLADEYLRLGAAQRKGVTGQALKNQTSTIAQLSAQAEALKLVADNSDIASSQFNRFVVATQLASQKIYQGRQKQLSALAFGLSAEAPAVNIGRSGEGGIRAARGTVGSLIASYGEVVKSEAALSDYAERLRALQSLVPYTSNEFRALEEAIAGVNREVSEIGLRGQKSAIQPLAGPATDLGSLKAFQLRESFEKKINDQLNRQDAIQERISQASLFDFQKEKLTLRLDEAVTALAEKRLGDAQRLTQEIDRQRISMERMNRAAQKPQVFGALGTAFMPVTGELPGGKLAPGSPAAKVAEAKANRESTEAAVALAKQKQKAIEAEADELRKGTQAATALGKQKLKALEDEAKRLRGETSNAVALAQQRMREEERAIAQAWKMRGGPELPPSMRGGTAGVRGQAFRAGGPGAATAALSAPRRVKSLVRSTQLAQERLNELEIRGVDVTTEKASAQKILNSLKEKDLQISDRLLNNVDDELNLIRDVLRLEKQRLTNQRLLGKAGLKQALKRLEEARGARQAFLGDVSPAEAIDKIVREFNKGGPAAGDAAENISDTFAANLKKGASGAAASAKSFATAATQAIKNVFGIASPSRFMIELVQNLVNTYIAEMQKSYPRIQAATDKAFGEQTLLRNVKELRATNRGFEFVERPSRGFRPFREAQGFGRETAGATREFNNMMLDFRKQIAELTTQPEIYSNLLRGLPNARITTDLIGAANRRALATELPSFLPIQRMMGPGELEREIAKTFADYVRTIRIPDPWVGLVGDYREFIDKVIAQTQRLSSAQLALPGTRIAGVLPAAEQQITSVQQQRIQRAYERSAQRQLAVFSEDAFAGAGRPALSAASFGFMADPARIGRLSGIGRALPPAIDVAASVIDGESRDLREVVRSLFDRISQGLGSVFGGGGGRPPVPPTGDGPTREPGDFNRRLSTAAEQGAEALLGLQGLRDPTKATTLELEALSGVLKEFRKILDPTSEGFERLEKQLRETAANLDRQVERRAPDADFLTRRFGPRTARGLSEGLIGGAFPLLFGQGIGASVGGGAGGFAGGFAGGNLGFGLSLAGTAAGQALDSFINNIKTLSESLKDPAQTLTALEEAGFAVDDSVKKTVQQLLEANKAYEAQTVALQQITDTLGSGSVELLNAYDKESKKLNSEYEKLAATLTSLLLPGLVGTVALVNDFVAILKEFQKVQIPEAFINFLTIVSPSFALARGQFELARARGRQAAEQAGRPDAPAEIKIDPKDVQKELDASIANAEKIRALRQQGTALERNAQDLRLSIEDTVYGLRKRAADMEREAAEFRRSVEDQVFSKRQELEQRLIENDRKRQQNAIDAFDLQLQRASTGLDPIAQGIVDAARQYLRVRAEGEADLQQNERQFKLQLQQIDQEVARYRLQVEDRISQMSIQRDEFTRDVARTKLQLERQIGDYVIQVEEYRLAMAKHRYEIEIDLEKKKQIAAQGGLMGGGGPVDQLMGAAAQREKFIQDQLVRRGFTPEQMAAVMGSIRQESGFNPYAKEQGGTGLGLFQWSFDRRSKVPAFTGNWQKDIQNQLDLFQRELNTTERKAGEILMGATTLQGAAAGMKQFERYGVAGRRYDYMKDYYARFTGGAGVPVSQQMEPGFTETFDLNAPAPTAPTALTIPELPSAPQLVQVNDLLAQYVDLQAKLKKALEDNNSAEARRVQLQIESARLAFEQQALSPIRQFQEQNRELQFEIEKRQARNRLLAEGVKPEIIEGEFRALEIKRALNSVLEGLEITTTKQVKAELERAGSSSNLVDSTFRLTEATLASLVATTQDVEKQEQLRKKLQEILDLRDKLAGKAEDEASKAAKGARGVAAEEAKPGQKLQDFIAQAIVELNDLEAVAVRVSQGIGDAVGNSLSSGIAGLVEGTTTAEQVFADFLKNIGQVLVQEAAKMIAAYVAIGIARQFAGLLTTSTGVSMSAGTAAQSGFDMGSSLAGMFKANGGPVNANEPYIVGERGPELFVPFQRGQVISNEDTQQLMGQAQTVSLPFTRNAETASPMQSNSEIKVKYESTVINGVEYVTAEQHRKGMAQAAERGRALALQALQNSPRTRRRVGI